MAFEAKEKNISKLLNDTIYLIPRNQRKFVWIKDNWRELYDDILFSIKNNSEHFIGSIVLKKELSQRGLEYYTIIDGQQRMFTITIFLAAIMLHLKKRDLVDDFEGTVKFIKAKDNKNNLINILSSDYHLGLSSLLNDLYNMDYQRAKDISCNAFIDSNIVDKRKDKLIGDCFKYYYMELQKVIDSSTPDYLLKIRDALVGMTYVNIIATTEEDSYTIFEILNARGQPLEDHELLKNYIMRYILPEEKRDLVKDIWEGMSNLLGKNMNSFISYYAIHKFGLTDGNLKEPYKNIKKSVGISSRDISGLLMDLAKKASYYNRIINPIKYDIDDEPSCSNLEYNIFKFFNRKKQRQFSPIIISLMHLKELEKITLLQYENCIEFIFKFFVCYIIIGREKSNSLSEIVYKYAPLLENQFSIENLNDFMDCLKARIPNQSWFNNAFNNLGWSNHWGLYKDEKEKEKVQIAIYLLEQYFNSANKDFDFTIEHILPDSEAESNAKISNLLPLEESLNKRCGNLPLAQKIPIYKESKYFSVKRFVERYENDPNKYTADKRLPFLSDIFYDKILSFKIK